MSDSSLVIFSIVKDEPDDDEDGIFDVTVNVGMLISACISYFWQQFSPTQGEWVSIHLLLVSGYYP